MTKSMGMEIIKFSHKKLVSQAPLEFNINDKGSVFGGSSSSLMIISAWSFIKLHCKQNGIDADIVIHKNETTWNKAMYSALEMHVNFTKTYDFKVIKTKILSNKHQRISCLIQLQDKNNEVYSTMTAHYVIIPKKVKKS